MFGRAPRTAERRESPRTRLRAPVEVHLPAGVRRGVIIDISRSGLQVEIDNPPAVGAPTLIKWDDQEAMGQVVWSKVNSCGIRFARPLGEDEVETAAAALRTKPAASVTNIQSGQRRSARWKREP